MPEAVAGNGGYMIAAYIVTAIILIGYSVLLARRARKSTSRRTDGQG
jgi:nitrate reductase gamma subunit